MDTNTNSLSDAVIIAIINAIKEVSIITINRIFDERAGLPPKSEVKLISDKKPKNKQIQLFD